MGKWLAYLIGGLLVLIAILASQGSGDTSASTAGSETHVITQNLWGCRDDAVLSKISTFRSQGDNTATVNYLQAQIDAGQCITLDKGDTVYLMDTQPLSGITKIRKEGQSAEYWTALEAVQ